jgi:KamA family protein
MGIPERIDEEFLRILQETPKQIWFVIHANHPKEFDEEIWAKLKEVQKLGIPVLCQSVLLEGVNDDVDTLKRLCEALVDHGVLPYYLHQLDRVQGAAHFEVSQEKGLWLIQELRQRLSGYAVPLYVQEISGELSKTPLFKDVHHSNVELPRS